MSVSETRDSALYRKYGGDLSVNPANRRFFNSIRQMEHPVKADMIDQLWAILKEDSRKLELTAADMRTLSALIIRIEEIRSVPFFRIRLRLSAMYARHVKAPVFLNMAVMVVTGLAYVSAWAGFHFGWAEWWKALTVLFCIVLTGLAGLLGGYPWFQDNGDIRALCYFSETVDATVEPPKNRAQRRRKSKTVAKKPDVQEMVMQGSDGKVRIHGVAFPEKAVKPKLKTTRI